MLPTMEEIDALSAVKEFALRAFPRCIVIARAAVLWDDPVFVALAEKNALRLDLDKNTCVGRELRPDYALFDASDVVCAYEKTRQGQQDRRIETDSDEFRRIIEHDGNTSYMDYEEPGFKVGRGKTIVIAVKPGALALAVVDHKGGRKDFNSKKSRERVVLQGRRFGTRNCFMATCDTARVRRDLHPLATRVLSAARHTFYRLNVEDVK